MNQVHTIQLIFPRTRAGEPRSHDEYADIAYTRMAEDIRLSRELGDNRAEALEYAIQSVRPLLIELGGDRARSLLLMADRISRYVYERPMPPPVHP